MTQGRDDGSEPPNPAASVEPMDISTGRWTHLAPWIKGAIGVLVLAAVGWQIWKTIEEFRERGLTLTIEPNGMIAAGLLYMAGLVIQGSYFYVLLRSSTHPISWLAAVRAYVVGHLGKYVPGKAFVVVMRVGLATPFGARAGSVAVAAFYETLLMMAAGGLMAGVGFVMAGRSLSNAAFLATLGSGVGLMFLVMCEPRVFNFLTRTISRRWPEAQASFPKINPRTLVLGLVMGLPTWTLWGLGHVAVIHGLGNEVAPPLWPVLIASVALATVLGFVVAVLPGGLGVREWVLMVTLEPLLGLSLAVTSTLALRLIQVFAELVVSGIVLGAIRPPAGRSAVGDESGGTLPAPPGGSGA